LILGAVELLGEAIYGFGKWVHLGFWNCTVKAKIGF
jgi:hypothetical protein